jgi:LuxR family maltose regulon positive regulatory protein
MDRLSAALSGKLTLISAPAGYGKTTLMTDWCAGSGKDTPLAWFSLDEGDNDPVSFLAYLVAALQNIQDDLGQDIEVLLQGSQNPPFPAILSILINELAAMPHDCVLVLEDYHLIENREIHQMLIFLLDHLPPQVHIAILTRADPPMPLGRLRAHGQITEIRLKELRFTLDETRRFFQDVMALNIQPKEMEILLSRTEGWVAGLQLAALSIQGQDDPSDAIQAFGSGYDYIVDYLIEEVLNRQTEARRAFLLQTSILSRLNGPLCDALTGQTGCENTLESLERANLFVSRLGGEDRWYRYHRLFASVMSNRLKRRYPDQIPELHRRAAEWYEQNNLIPQAIEHALTAEDYPYAASLISSIALDVLSAGVFLPCWHGSANSQII